MVVELYHSPHCPACRSLERMFRKDFPIRRRDLARHLELAARLGITRPPALVVDGRVVAQGAAVVPAVRRLAAHGISKP